MSRARTPLPRAGELDARLHAESELDSRGRRLRGLDRTACVIAQGAVPWDHPRATAPGSGTTTGSRVREIARLSSLGEMKR